MRIGYRPEGWAGSGWGERSPVKVSVTIEWDSIAFWRIVPHKHIPDRLGCTLLPWPEEMIVNQRCDKCLRWYVKATGRLHKALNELEK